MHMSWRYSILIRNSCFDRLLLRLASRSALFSVSSKISKRLASFGGKKWDVGTGTTSLQSYRSVTPLSRTETLATC